MNKLQISKMVAKIVIGVGVGILGGILQKKILTTVDAKLDNMYKEEDIEIEINESEEV